MSFNELKQCRYGQFVYNKNDWPIGMSLKTYGEYAWEELELLSQFIKPGNLVVDAGANIGTHTVRFAQLVTETGCVVSFEPQRISYQTLCANVSLNSLVNVYPFHAALGKEVGTILVPVRDQYSPNNFGGVPLAGVKNGEQTDLLTLDSIGLKACDVIKADVEGMEAELLMGAEKTIARYRPILYMEADGAQSSEAIKILIGWKYKCYWSMPLLYNRNNFFDHKDDVFRTEDRTIVSVNMICVPEEKNILVEGFREINSPSDSPVMEIEVPA